MSNMQPSFHDASQNIIHVEDDPEPDFVFRPDDILVFIIFWALGAITFLQFFSRYILNDSIAWTEEIARYLLMWVTFCGSALVFRRRTNIAVELLVEILPSRAGQFLRFAADVITLAFVILLTWFAWRLTERMSIQSMTVISVSMSVVYGGIFIGCLLMLWRCVGAVIDNARRQWMPTPAAFTLPD